MRAIFLLLLAIFLINQVGCQSVNTTHIGPASEIVLYTYQTISCSINRWTTFRDDSFRKINYVRFNYQSFLNTLVTGYNKIINKPTTTANINAINKYMKNINASINQLSDSFDALNNSLLAADTRFKTVIDTLVRNSYASSIKAISNSINNQKTCVPKITREFEKLFQNVYAGLGQCTNQTIDTSVIESQLAYGYSTATTIFNNMFGCLVYVSQSYRDGCIANAATGLQLNQNMVGIFFDKARTLVFENNVMFPSYISDCITTVSGIAQNQIDVMVSVANTCQKCSSCVGDPGPYIGPVIDAYCEIQNTDDLTYLTYIFSNSSTLLTALEDDWVYYREDSLLKMDYVAGNKYISALGIYGLYRDLANNYYYLSLDGYMYNYYSQIYTMVSNLVDPSIEKIRQIMYTYNEYFRVNMDSYVLLANDGFSSTIQKNWNNFFCVNGVFTSFFQVVQAAVDYYTFNVHQTIIISDINAAVSNGYDIWLNKSIEFYACLSSVNELSSRQVKSNAIDCFNRALKSIGPVTTALNANFKLIAKLLDQVSFNLYDVLKASFTNTAMPSVWRYVQSSNTAVLFKKYNCVT